MTPESVISWLLEHPEVAAEDTDSISSVYDSDTESISLDNALGAQGVTYVRLIYFFICVVCFSDTAYNYFILPNTFFHSHSH